MRAGGRTQLWPTDVVGGANQVIGAQFVDGKPNVRFNGAVRDHRFTRADDWL